MIRLIQILITLLMLFCQCLIGQNKQALEPFNEVIISPHIETTFVKGSEESVSILYQKVDDDKVNIEVKNGKLRIYLDGAKEITKQVKVKENGYKRKIPLYKEKQLHVLITYKNIDEVSIRGEEKIEFKSKIETKDFSLTAYGESEILIDDVDIKNLTLNFIGESELAVNAGKVDFQKVKVIGEGVIDLEAVENRESKLKAIGEAEFRVNSTEYIRFSAIGEAELFYTGNATVDNVNTIGETTVQKIK